MFSPLILVYKIGGVMKARRIVRGSLFVAGLFTAGAMSAQFVSLSRCQAAYPCAFPFGLQYRADPLIAGQFGRFGNAAVSTRVPLQAPLTPELDRRPDLDFGAVDAAVRKSLEMLHPPPGARNKKTSAGEAVGSETPAEKRRP
jgi:hypothetical protein